MQAMALAHAPVQEAAAADEYVPAGHTVNRTSTSTLRCMRRVRVATPVQVLEPATLEVPAGQSIESLLQLSRQIFEQLTSTSAAAQEVAATARGRTDHDGCDIAVFGSTAPCTHTTKHLC